MSGTETSGETELTEIAKVFLYYSPTYYLNSLLGDYYFWPWLFLLEENRFIEIINSDRQAFFTMNIWACGLLRDSNFQSWLGSAENPFIAIIRVHPKAFFKMDFRTHNLLKDSDFRTWLLLPKNPLIKIIEANPEAFFTMSYVCDLLEDYNFRMSLLVVGDFFLEIIKADLEAFFEMNIWVCDLLKNSIFRKRFLSLGNPLLGIIKVHPKAFFKMSSEASLLLEDSAFWEWLSLEGSCFVEIIKVHTEYFFNMKHNVRLSLSNPYFRGRLLEALQGMNSDFLVEDRPNIEKLIQRFERNIVLWERLERSRVEALEFVPEAEMLKCLREMGVIGEPTVVEKRHAEEMVHCKAAKERALVLLDLYEMDSKGLETKLAAEENKGLRGRLKIDFSIYSLSEVFPESKVQIETELRRMIFMEEVQPLNDWLSFVSLATDFGVAADCTRAASEKFSSLAIESSETSVGGLLGWAVIKLGRVLIAI